MLKKQATVRIKQPKKKIQINKKYTNDFEDEGEGSDERISLTLNELSSLIENSNQNDQISKKLSKIMKNKSNEASKNDQINSSNNTNSKKNNNTS